MEKQIRKYILSFVVFLALATGSWGEDYKNKVIPLNGKLVTSDDPTQIGTNFQILQNLRYGEGHVKGVGGMSKINPTAIATYTNVRNGFHFSKSRPAESHTLVHAFNGAGTAAVIQDNIAAIPATGNMVATNIYTLTSTESGSFSSAPDGNVIFANGDECLIWGGSEDKLAAFVTSSAAVTYTVTNANDYTDILNNTRQTSDQVATVSTLGGKDAYTELLLHGDGADGTTTITDSSASAHIATAGNHAQLDTEQIKFGSSSILFDGTDDYLTTADDPSFDFSTGNFTIDFWVRLSQSPVDHGAMTLFSRYGAATDYTRLTLTASGAQIQWEFDNYDTGVQTLYFIRNTSMVINTWYHIALVRSGTSFYLFQDGVQLGATYAGGGARVASVSVATEIGRNNGTSFLEGWLDEYRISKGAARWTSAFTVPTQPYGNNSNYFLVGSKRQLRGFKLYISSGNTLASTMTVKEWRGTTWDTLSITDGTSSGGKTLAQTGSVSWTASGAAKTRYINGTSLFWYQVSFDAGTASIYYVTLDAPMQSIQNIWDGSDGTVLKFLKYDGTTYKDYTIEVNDDSQATYADLSSLQAAHSVYLGFLEPQQGFDIKFVAGSENSTTSTQLSVYFWNNREWQGATAVNDGTATSTTSLSKGGVISFQGAAPGTEAKRSISDEVPLYYYKLTFVSALDADVKVSEVRGIPFPPSVPPYKIATMFQGRTLLMNNKSGDKNKILYSAFQSPDVYMGSDDSGGIFVGDDSEITAAATLNLVITSALEQLIITKKNETYRMFGNGPDAWDLQKISSTVGCVAPKTMRTANIPLDTAGSLGKNIAIWQGSEGIYITDGRTPSPIHEDIKNVFDKRSITSINRNKIADSVGFIDQQNLEYHWLWASGTSTTLDKEYVFDLRRWKWYEIVRGSGKQLQTGFPVVDTLGNTYNYGTLDTGYIERLEYGNDFDGGNIVHTMQLGDIPLGDNPLFETRAQYLNLTMMAKTTTTNTVSYTHYVDGATSGSTPITLSPVASGKRIANVVANINSLIGVFHSPKFTITTNNESTGFEPLYIGYFFKVEREHLR